MAGGFRVHRARPTSAFLGTLTISLVSATAGSLWSTTISGATNGSTVLATSSDGTTLAVGGAGTTRTISGTFSASGTPNITLTETLVGASNTPHTSPLIGVSVASAGSNFIADSTALNAMISAGVGASGGKTYTLAAADFGTGPFYGCNFSANPIVIQGTWTGDIHTSTRFQWMEIAGCKGITFKNMNVYDQNSGQWALAIESNCQDLILNGVTLINTAVAVEGAPANGKGLFILGNLTGSNIQFIGQNDATKPDIWGFGNGINIQESANVTLKNVTMGNNGTDHCLIYGADNITIDGLLQGTCYFNDPDHPDFIQTDWSGYRPGAQNNNLVIKNCGVQRPPGQLGSQGYFIGQVNGLVLQDNWSYDAYGNSVSLSTCNNATLTNNFLMPVNDIGSGAALTIRGGSTNVTVTNNSAYSVNLVGTIAGGSGPTDEGPYPGYSESGTVNLTPVDPGDYTALDAWLAAHPNARRRHMW